MKTVLCLALLFAPSTVHAQGVDLPTVLFAAGATADWVTTHEALQQGRRELNPMLRWLDHKPTAMVALGAGMDAVGYLGWVRLTRHHPKWRKAGLYVAAGVRVGVAVYNHRLNRRRR